MTFFIGLDLGQAADYTALSVDDFNFPTHRVRHLQRFPLGTSYPAIVDQVIHIRDVLGGGILVVDATGVGRPVVDLFWESGLSPYAITITGSGEANNDATANARKGGMIVSPSLRDQLTWRVPKRDLVGVLSIAFQNKNLKVSSKLPDAKTLTDELLNFKVKINTKTAHDSYEAWREGVHDDLVLSVALAIWVARMVGSQEIPLSMAAGNSSIETVRTGNPIKRMGEGFSGGDLPGLGG